MIRVLALSLLLAITSLANAEVYKWKGADGKTHYSDLPPSGNAGEHKMGIRTTRPAPAEQENSPGKSIAEQDAEFKKRRIEAEEKKAKEEKQLAEASERERNCAVAKGNLKVLEQGGRIVRYNDKGEKVYVEDNERPQLLADAKKAVESWCK